MLVQRNQFQEKLGETDAGIEELRTVVGGSGAAEAQLCRTGAPVEGNLGGTAAGPLGGLGVLQSMELEGGLWRNAEEGFLNTQRFDLLVEPECFAEALSIYEREKRTPIGWKASVSWIRRRRSIGEQP